MSCATEKKLRQCSDFARLPVPAVFPSFWRNAVRKKHQQQHHQHETAGKSEQQVVKKSSDQQPQVLPVLPCVPQQFSPSKDEALGKLGGPTHRMVGTRKCLRPELTNERWCLAVWSRCPDKPEVSCAR